MPRRERHGDSRSVGLAVDVPLRNAQRLTHPVEILGGRIVAETLAPGARVADVARRWQLSQQVFTWRRQARNDRPTMAPPPAPSVASVPSFVPIITETAAAASASAVTSTPPAIEVELAGAVVRVSSAMDATTLTRVLRAVRASASRR